MPYGYYALTPDGRSVVYTNGDVFVAPIDGRRAPIQLTSAQLVAVPQTWPVKEAERLTPAELFALLPVRFNAIVPRPLSDFWSLAEHRGGTEVEFRGPGA